MKCNQELQLKQKPNAFVGCLIDIKIVIEIQFRCLEINPYMTDQYIYIYIYIYIYVCVCVWIYISIEY